MKKTIKNFNFLLLIALVNIPGPAQAFGFFGLFSTNSPASESNNSSIFQETIAEASSSALQSFWDFLPGWKTCALIGLGIYCVFHMVKNDYDKEKIDKIEYNPDENEKYSDSTQDYQENSPEDNLPVGSTLQNNHENSLVPIKLSLAARLSKALQMQRNNAKNKQ